MKKTIATILLFLSLSSANELTTIEKSCNEGNITQCHVLGLKYTLKKHKNYTKATEYLAIACHAGKIVACQQLGDTWAAGGHGIAQDYGAAAKYYTQACDHNMSYSCLALAGMHDTGKGFKQSYTDALPYYETACHLKNYNGCNALAMMYMRGDMGVKQDYAKAVSLLTIACDAKPKEGMGGTCNKRTLKFAEMMLGQIKKEATK